MAPNVFRTQGWSWLGVRNGGQRTISANSTQYGGPVDGIEGFRLGVSKNRDTPVKLDGL